MVFIKDLWKYVSVSNKAMQHGLDGKCIPLQAAVISKIGDILVNSIVINEAHPKKPGVKASWVLLGAAEDHDGNIIYVRSVVNQSNGHLEDVSAFYAAYGKKGNKKETSRNLSAGRVAEESAEPSSGSNISIAELLNGVKEYFSDVAVQHT